VPQAKTEGLILEDKSNTRECTRSEKLLELTFENSLDAILLTIDGTIIMANPAACKMFGMSEDEIKQAGRDRLFVKDNASLAALKRRAKETKATTELTLKRKDGSTFQGESSSNVFIDTDGIKKAITILRDLTEHKKTEQTLKENKNRLELAQHIANLGSWEFNVKKEEAIWSKQLYEMFGLNPKTKAPNIAEYSKLIHPADAEIVGEKMGKFLSNANIDDTMGFDYCIVTPQGLTKNIHTERMVIEVDENNKPSRIMGIEQDITERVREQEELFRNQELLQNIINSTDLVIFARDLNGRLILLNKTQEKNYRMTEAEALGTTPYDIYSKETADKMTSWDKKVYVEGKSYQYEETLFVNGKVRTYVTNKFPLKDSKGVVYGLGAVITDITDRKKMEEQLEHYSKDLEALVKERTNQLREKERLAGIGETAGMIGHDIRNPLQAIVSELYMARQAMQKGGMGAEEAVESIDFVQEQVDYISKIVQDLQDYARPLKPEFQEADLSDILVKVFSTIAVPDKIKLNVHVKGTLKTKTDQTFMKRALTNLINNAIQAMPDGGELKLAGNAEEKAIIITVGDTGVGIPENVKPLIFEPLVSAKAKGQGLGLAVVKRLIEALGGRVCFDSQEGKGTTFTIELPRQ
jgi:PAS domain S-box-containing protein